MFDVDVTFTLPKVEGTIGSTITYGSLEIVPNDWTTVPDDPEIPGEDGYAYVTVTIQVADGDSIEFSNIPDGVTWKVDEDLYTDYQTYYGEMFDNGTPEDPTDDYIVEEDYETGSIGETASTSDITNNRDTTMETGISLDSIPYIMLLVLTVLGLGVLFTKKRRSSNI